MAKNNESDVISIFDEDGNMKSKEQFLNDVAKMYDTTAEEIQTQNGNMGNSMLDLLLNKELQVDDYDVLNSFDFYERTIFIADEIQPSLGTEIVRKIRFWNHIDTCDGTPIEERTPIKIYIDTPGGDIFAVFSIMSAIKMSKTPVYTITYGRGYSGGFFIGICGHKRFGFSNSSYLFHEGMTIDGGDAHKFLQHVDFYKLQLKKIKDITIQNTKITNDEYDARQKDDWFFSPTEALHYGIIDEILNDFGGE